MASGFFSSPFWISTALVLVALKVYMKVTAGICKSKARLDGKTVIVTGANSGIGLEATKDLVSRGARVLMVCRNTSKGAAALREVNKETGTSLAIVKQMDLASLKSIRCCAQEILKDEPHIDILLNNAGTSSCAFTTSEDGLDTLMQSNHFGPFLFTNLLLGRIKQTPGSRIINTSSELHKAANMDVERLDLSNISYSLMGYSISKLCNILFTNELADKLKGTGVTVNSLTPGVVLTNILGDSGPWFNILWNFIIWVFLKSAKEGAQTSVYACVSDDLANTTGKYLRDCKVAPVSETALDKELGRKLWKYSEDAVKLQPSEKFY